MSGTGAVGRAVDGLGSLVQGAGQNVAGLVRRELDAARNELMGSARDAAKGAGLLGGAGVAGGFALLFGMIGVWQGLGRVIGPAKSAFVVAALSGGAAAALASAGRTELGSVKNMPRNMEDSLREATHPEAL
jgi:hypothetical protein